MIQVASKHMGLGSNPQSAFCGNHVVPISKAEFATVVLKCYMSSSILMRPLSDLMTVWSSITQYMIFIAQEITKSTDFLWSLAEIRMFESCSGRSFQVGSANWITFLTVHFKDQLQWSYIPFIHVSVMLAYLWFKGRWGLKRSIGSLMQVLLVKSITRISVP